MALNLFFSLKTFFSSLVSLLIEVASFWYNKLWNLFLSRRPEALLIDKMRRAMTYTEWLDLAYSLDALLCNDLWRANPKSRKYDYKLISERLDAIMDAKEMGDILELTNILRSGLIRNLGNISNKKLFTYIGTKFLIEKYNVEVMSSFRFLLNSPVPNMTMQQKLDLVHDTRQSYGLSTLVLQGGVLFGLCHLGVVRALFEHNLLPRIITGVGVGALIVSLVCVHTDEELPEVLKGRGINLSAFAKQKPAGEYQGFQRLRRWLTKGYLLDIEVLEQVVKDNIGDLTFEEAYARTKRVLNIAVHSTNKYVPTLFNFLTTPNVLIWSAACASNAMPGLYEETKIMCKDEHGKIVYWEPTGSPVRWKSYTETNRSEREAPYTRVSELFNVNHFIVSQARPYMAPFMPQDVHYGTYSWRSKLVRLIVFEIRHRLAQLDFLGLLPFFFRQLLTHDDRRLMNSEIITIVPDLNIRDFWKLFVDAPRTREDIRYWSRKGEQSTWFALPVIRQRCGVEFVLDGVYEIMFSQRTRL
ncbi:acyl transferase/acyl hydrolase/lysophospholipase [Lipomyces japonicus]|uniref:acyl transferase/acyl hydrolase/lysophospholipase n=1 Tax=Lipomyces japonicus TaxID=56871 RepID=UPI0034CDE4FC